MTIAQRVGQIVVEREINQRIQTFVLAAKYIALAKGGGITGAYEIAKKTRALPPVVEVLKAAQDAGQMSGSWGGDLSPLNGLADAFLVSLRSRSVFDAMLPFSPEVPFRTKVAVTTSGATGNTINEAMVKPISKLSLTAVDMEEQKTLAIVVTTEDLLRFGNVALFQAELQRAVATATDAAFITKITAGISPTTSNGGTAIAVLQDISAGLAALSLDAGSKVFCATSPDLIKQLAFKTTSTGERAFPELTVNGGVVGGVEFFPTSGVSAQFVFFDATQIAHAQRGIELDTAQHAMVQLDAVGDSPQTAATPFVSLWQMNMVGVQATRWWDAQRLRDGAVSVISSINYTGDSPN